MRARPRTSSTSRSASHSSWLESSRPPVTWSRCQNARSTSIVPVTASAAPGTSRAAAIASGGRSSAFDGMQAKYEHSPPTRPCLDQRDRRLGLERPQRTRRRLARRAAPQDHDPARAIGGHHRRRATTLPDRPGIPARGTDAEGVQAVHHARKRGRPRGRRCHRRCVRRGRDRASIADIITPLIAAIFGKPSFASLSFTINKSTFLYGDFLNAVITFVTIAAAIFFLVVKPLNVARGAAGGGRADRVADDASLPRVPERDPDRRQALRALHVRGRPGLTPYRILTRPSEPPRYGLEIRRVRCHAPMRRRAALAGALAVIATGAAATPATGRRPPAIGARGLRAGAGTRRPVIRHVIVIVMENHSYVGRDRPRAVHHGARQALRPGDELPRHHPPEPAELPGDDERRASTTSTPTASRRVLGAEARTCSRRLAPPRAALAQLRRVDADVLLPRQPRALRRPARPGRLLPARSARAAGTCARSGGFAAGRLHFALHSGHAPALMFVTPNLCNDMHDCSLARATLALALDPDDRQKPAPTGTATRRSC